MTLIGIEKTLTGIEKNIFNVLKRGADLCKDSNTTNADIVQYWKDISRVGESSSQSSLNAAKTQVKEALSKHLLASGTWAEGEVDPWYLSQWDSMLKTAAMWEQINKDSRKEWWRQKTESLVYWSKVLGTIMGVGLLFACFLRIVGTNGSTNAPSLEDQEWNSAVSNANITTRWLEQTTVTANEFTSMLSNLGPAPTPSEPPTPLAAVPAEIQATEAEPVTVEVDTPTGTQQITTTVRQFYQAAPPSVRQEMEAPKIDRGEDPNDCFHRHCLTPHKDFTISADFDSGGVQRVHVHY